LAGRRGGRGRLGRRLLVSGGLGVRGCEGRRAWNQRAGGDRENEGEERRKLFGLHGVRGGERALWRIAAPVFWSRREDRRSAAQGYTRASARSTHVNWYRGHPHADPDTADSPCPPS